MKHYIDSNTRVVLRCTFPFGYRFILQRKGRYFWKNKSYMYPSIVADKDLDYLIHWLLWDEKENRGYKDEKKIGEELIRKHQAEIDWDMMRFGSMVASHVLNEAKKIVAHNYADVQTKGIQELFKEYKSKP